jgi:hypothetical protein
MPWAALPPVLCTTSVQGSLSKGPSSGFPIMVVRENLCMLQYRVAGSDFSLAPPVCEGGLCTVTAQGVPR